MTDNMTDNFLGRPEHGPVALSPIAGSAESEAPSSSQTFLPHPNDSIEPYSLYDTDTLARVERSAETARRINARVDREQSEQPHFYVLHDRLRTTDGWQRNVDAYLASDITVPAAGAFSLTSITATNPLLPGNPGTVMVHPYVNYFSIAAAGTTLTGIWYAELVVNSQALPLGVFSGLGSFSNRAGLLGSVPYMGGMDDKSTIAQLRVTVHSGATVSAVTMFAQLSLSFAYRLVDAPVRQRASDAIKQRVSP